MGRGTPGAWRLDRCQICGHRRWPSYTDMLKGEVMWPTLDDCCHCGHGQADGSDHATPDVHGDSLSGNTLCTETNDCEVACSTSFRLLPI